MHLYRFFNPSADGADSCEVFVSANHWDAIHSYVERYYPFFHELKLYKDFDDKNAILMEESVKKLENGRVMFYELFAIKIKTWKLFRICIYIVLSIRQPMVLTNA